MKISQAFKVFELNILRQAGVMVTPEQLGLKSDPIADLQAKGPQSPFNKLLGQVASNDASLGELPSPPIPPADPNDTAAQAQYHQDLLTYNRNFQLYNQKFMQLILGRLGQIQQNMAAQQKSQPEQSSSTDIRSLGIGGILSGVSDI